MPSATTAESNRSPFDLPEGESELVAGYFTEYSGFKFALFFLGEYVGMLSVSGLGTTLFLGGWSAPFSFLTWVPSWIWFFGKVMLSICVFIWLRGTLPRLRQDQLMNFAWKFVVPLSLINLFVAGLWRFHGRRVGALGRLLGDSVGCLRRDGQGRHAKRNILGQGATGMRSKNCRCRA
jgi:NADH-quinone oxidoreductase subunit H